jgi:hypothetical protein
MLRRQAGEDPLISENDLRHLVAEVDDQHHTGMATLADDLGEIHSMAATRRRFIKGVGLGGLVLTIGQAALPVSSLLSSAYAQTPTTNPPNDKGALQLTASVLPVESQHAVVLGQVLGIAPFTAVAGSTDPYAGNGYVPYFVSQDQKIDPVAYPVATKG